MPHQYTVPLKKLIKDLNLQILYYPKTEEEILVSHAELMRPGLAFTGFFQGFVPARINMIGRTELAYLETLPPHLLRQSLEGFLSRSPKAVIITQDFSFRPLFLELAEKYCVPLMQSPENTTHMAAQLNAKLSLELAPRTTVHGVLMEIYGEGVLLTGDSGVGKSETAIELVKRGHQLVADDAVEIRRVSNRLHGVAPELIRHYIEVRGVGIIDVQQLFGMGAVQFDSDIEIVIHLEPWQDGKFYDRLGLEGDTYTILGVQLPYVTIPVRPGRNLAGIVEIAAMKNRQMRYGYNSARDFMTQFDKKMDELARQAKEKQ